MNLLNLRPFLAVTILFIMAISVACQAEVSSADSGAVPPLVGDAVDGLVIQPQVSPEPTLPSADHVTNIPEVDQALAVILSNSIAEKRSLIDYTTVGCTHQLGMGGPPKCDQGIAEGTAITYFPVLGPGEGQPVMPGNIDGTLDFIVTELVAVYRPPVDAFRSEDYPIGEYSLLFATEQDDLPVTVQLRNGRIVRLDFGPYPVEHILPKIKGEFILNRYPELLIAPTETTEAEESDNQDNNVACLPRTDWPTYTIVAGDNLYNLAGEINTTVAALAEANCIDKPESLMPGQIIYVPVVPVGATSPPPPTATPVTSTNAPQIIEFALGLSVYRPGPGEEIRVMWNTSSLNTEICFQYAQRSSRECHDVTPSGEFTHTLVNDSGITEHWLDVTITAVSGNNSVQETERVLLRCQNSWFKEGLSDWCPATIEDERPAIAQWFEGGLIIVEDHHANVIFDEPGTPCIVYKGLPLLKMDTSFLQPPNGSFHPDSAFGKLYLGHFPQSETFQSRLGWGTSERVDFSWNMQCEETPTGTGTCFGLAPDGRVYSVTAVLGAPDSTGVSVGQGTCPFVN